MITTIIIPLLLNMPATHTQSNSPIRVPSPCFPILHYPAQTPTPELTLSALRFAQIHKRQEQVAVHAAMVAQSAATFDTTVRRAIRTFAPRSPTQER
jgi:hypothetical protein